MAVATLKAICDATRIEGEALAAWSKEWQRLSDQDKQDLRDGVGNGTLTY